MLNNAGIDLSTLCDVDASEFGTSATNNNEADHRLRINEGNDEALDALSDVSDNSDLFHVSAVESAEPRTEEDADIRICRTIATHLRDFPLLPPDGRDSEKVHSYRDVQSCVAFPFLHCGFKGCGFHFNAAPKYHWHHELTFAGHLHEEHRLKEMASVPQAAWEKQARDSIYPKAPAIVSDEVVENENPKEN